jgi:hypothetical protein
VLVELQSDGTVQVFAPVVVRNMTLVTTGWDAF